MRFEDETAADTAIPPKSADLATSGQLGPKSGKLRQDSKKPRPSERLRRDGDPPPGGETAGADSHSGSANKKAAQNGKRMEKSKLCMEKSGEKLNTAREKLESQKPQKKPGPIKKVSRAAGYQSWRYVHGKIHQIEHENAGTEAAHKTELAGEHLARAVHAYQAPYPHSSHPAGSQMGKQAYQRKSRLRLPPACAGQSGLAK